MAKGPEKRAKSERQEPPPLEVTLGETLDVSVGTSEPLTLIVPREFVGQRVLVFVTGGGGRRPH